MAEERSLMRPLRSDSLRPRPSTQAAWQPDAPAPEVPETENEPEMFVEDFIPADARPLMELLNTFAPETAPAPAGPPEEEPSDLDAAIAALLADGDEDDDDALPSQDALPTESMPQPVCVPLMDPPAPARRKKGWLWLVLIALLAGAAGAAWHFDLLRVN